MQDTPVRFRLSPTLMGVAFCALMILLGPLYTAPGYDWVMHTSSDLGAQNTPHAYLMNLGFAALGLGVALDARSLWWRNPLAAAMFFLFGICMVLAGTFSLRPIDLSLAYNEDAHALHSLFATVAGVCFSVGAIVYAARASGRARTLSLIAGILGGLLPLAMMLLPEYQGALQRAMFMITFPWLAAFVPQPKTAPARLHPYVSR